MNKVGIKEEELICLPTYPIEKVQLGTDRCEVPVFDMSQNILYPIGLTLFKFLSYRVNSL
jgi:hypothetical protein